MNNDTNKQLSLIFASNLRQRLKNKNSKYYKYNWQERAREKQCTPAGNWRWWVILSGRGWGKTDTGANWVLSHCQPDMPAINIGLVGQTQADVRDTMINGDSGILANSPIWNYPKENKDPKSKVVLEWPNGTIAYGFSGDKPDQLRGPNLSKVWCDEFAKFQYPEETYQQITFSMRKGKNTQGVFTTTPRPIERLKKLVKHPKAHVTTGSSFENKDNLDPNWFEDIRLEYEGTRRGQQELYGVILEDVEGALWTPKLIEDNYIDFDDLPEIVWSAVGLDPPGTTTNECGIVLVGKDLLRKRSGVLPNYYFLADKSLLGTPQEWGKAGINLWYKSQAHAIYAERNFGGDMVKSTLLGIDDSVLVRELTSSKGKNIRAEPVVSLTEQGRLKFVKQAMTTKLFEEMTEWIPHESKYSPNRLDALVFATIANNKKGGTGIYFK